MEAEQRARAVLAGAREPVGELRELAAELRGTGRTALVADLLSTVARDALQGAGIREERVELATAVLRDHQQFGYARRLLARARHEGPDSEWLRQQQALCTYKDLELPAWRRLDRALQILQEGGALEESTDAETLGIAGAVYKRRWEVDAQVMDLENALSCYRRGFAQAGHPECWYAGINAAFVADQLASLEDRSQGGAQRAVALRREADEIRTEIREQLPGGDGGWNDATLGEALFGLGDFAGARERLAAVAHGTPQLWRQESTATQMAALQRLRGFADDPQALRALAALLGENAPAVARVSTGKVGVALSGGGFRASLFHIGVLARLAECNVLRRVEALSCVSGGSIIGAFYYLKLRRLLEATPDADIPDRAYVDLVRELADEFMAGVRADLRRRLTSDVRADVRMALTSYSRTDRVAELLEQLFYGPLREEPGPWRMPDLLVNPAGRTGGFSLRYENWMRAAKVPVLVLNATTLNTGHSWQFTATWMGEPPNTADERMDAVGRLRRLYYPDAPDDGDLRCPHLAVAVAASACVPGIFPPVRLTGLYDGIDVELVDGGVHDNQGVASLLEQDCTVLLVSDASGQLRDDVDPQRWALSVLNRSNSVLMKRVRGAQYGDLLGRCRSGTLRGFMGVHLTKGLSSTPINWRGCPEPWRPEDDELPNTPRDYGPDPGVQRALAQLRTDLDAFSEDEAYALMAAGYQMTKTDLADALPDLAAGNSALELGSAWPFWAHLEEMRPGRATRLSEALAPGAWRFLRRPRTWLINVRKAVPFVGGKDWGRWSTRPLSTSSTPG